MTLTVPNLHLLLEVRCDHRDSNSSAAHSARIAPRPRLQSSPSSRLTPTPWSHRSVHSRRISPWLMWNYNAMEVRHDAQVSVPSCANVRFARIKGVPSGRTK